MKKILIIAVHPDDESLGAGGTLLHHKSNGDQIHWLILTSPSNLDNYTNTFIKNREKNIKQVAKAYGFHSVTELNFPTTNLSEISESTLVQAISKVFHTIEPNIIYMPFYSDVHGDHKIAFSAIFSCTKLFRYPSIEKVLMIETISETDQAISTPSFSFSPNVFIDITPHIEQKLKILSFYETEIKEPPFPRSLEAIRALACVRGATIHTHYAEAFMLLKEVIK